MKALPILITLIFLSGCGPNLTDDPIPIVSFPDIELNINLPENVALRNDGGYRSLSSGGVRGIIVYRKDQNTYMAFERNCSFHPNEACSTVDVDVSGLFMLDPCCGSSFSFDDGQPTGGPAWRPLRQYRTYTQSGNLTITEDILVEP